MVHRGIRSGHSRKTTNCYVFVTVANVRGCPPGEGYATNNPDLEESLKKRPGHAGIADMPIWSRPPIRYYYFLKIRVPSLFLNAFSSLVLRYPMDPEMVLIWVLERFPM